ncbi:hypothetical protein O4J56_01450 [Nocardiopsis sp. RSe5-2]|uniref:Uncharacterized protein n=1 Tax=Nocardiopsis endophytica TaxID=3018445 RepID=A0ABT4TX92_9ACTN|nr:hypothetical protein [Nocardiopsis endophytica]MDA2809290.1 hypothetical protein [Nocardiopsis endophytica]
MSPSPSPSPSPSASATATTPGSGPSDASGPAPEPEVAFGYTPSEPASDARPLSTAAAWLLPLLAVAALALRLSVGWPRFPPRYRGRRRVARDAPMGP